MMKHYLKDVHAHILTDIHTAVCYNLTRGSLCMLEDRKYSC